MNRRELLRYFGTEKHEEGRVKSREKTRVLRRVYIYVILPSKLYCRFASKLMGINLFAIVSRFTLLQFLQYCTSLIAYILSVKFTEIKTLHFTQRQNIRRPVKY